MEEKQNISKDLINFFAEHLKHHKIEKEKRKLLEIQKQFTLGEELFNSISHGIGALIMIAGLVLLIVWSNSPKQVLGMTIFGSTAIFMYLMSTLHHAFPVGKTKLIFELFDHSSIYLLIAGTYTPLCFIVLQETTPTLSWVIFGIQWGLAIIGIVFKSLAPDKYDLVHLIIFLIMGWSIIFFIGPLLNSMSLLGFLFILVGGLCYSIGLIFYLFTWFKFHHGLWHLFVLAGTILHFFAMFRLLNIF